jgi:hypothetical protein
VPFNAVIQLGPLGVRQRRCVGFQALPHHIQQFRFLGGGEIFNLMSQGAH